MAVLSNGRFDWAIWRPGPDEKSGYPGRRSSIAEGVVYHSAEGSEASLLAVLDGPRMASWTASNLKDGRFLQHYPVERIVWTNGSKNANIKFRGVESEGVAGEPLTQPQIDNLIRCAEDMMDYFGWQGFRRGVEAFEHNEMTQFGATPTACPSGRIPWQTIEEGMMALSDDDKAWLAGLMRGVVQAETEKKLFNSSLRIGDDSYTSAKYTLQHIMERLAAIEAKVDGITGGAPAGSFNVTLSGKAEPE